MKKILTILFLWLAVWGGEAMCQSIVWETNGADSDTTIVRHWSGDTYIVYSRTGSLGGTFSCHDDASGVLTKFEIPSYLVFYDFRIAHDTIFAGGAAVIGGEKRGVLACIDINNMMSGAGYIDTYVFQSAQLLNTTCGVDYLDMVVGVKRLALFEDGGATRMAYIADNHIVTPIDNNVVYRRVGYGDAALLSNTVWDMGSYHYNKDGWEEFTDICCTTNKIVITARNKEYDSDLMRFQVFDKVRNFAQEPLSVTSIYYGFNDHSVVSRVAVTATVGDLVAMSYHYKDGTEHGLAVKVVDVAGSWPVLTHSEDITDPKLLVSAEQVSEMAYNQESDMLRILSRMYYLDKSWRSCVTSAWLSTISSGLFHIRHSPYVDYLHSIDNYTMGGFISSGMGSDSWLNIYNERQGEDSNCGLEWAINADATLPALKDIVRHHCTITPSSTGDLVLPGTTYEKPIYVKCQ